MKTKKEIKITNNKEIQIQKKIKLSRCYRLFLFFIMMNMDLTMDISSGIFSSSAKNIKSQLKLTDAKFGGFGTATSIGRIISSFLFFFINEKVNHKHFLTILIGFHSFFLFSFKFTSNAQILLLIRTFQGLTQTSPSIYFPVWINQFGIKEYKTIQISSIQLFQALGKLVGHFIVFLVGFDNWQNGFLISGSYLVILNFCCIISNEKYFKRTLYAAKKDLNDNNNMDNKDKDENNSECTVFEEHGDKEINADRNYFTNLYLLFHNPLYIISLICRSIIRGLITCLHYWFSDFMRNIVQCQPFTVTIAYAIICISGPLGGIIANYLLKPVLGSYESRKASWPLVILQIVASVFGICIGLMKQVLSITFVTIIFLIFNSSVIALIQGILISCVDKSLSGTGFAFANACTQVLTAGPTPMVYGVINDKFKEKYPWLAMVCIMSINLIAVPLLIYLAILRNKKFDEEIRNEKDKEKELIDIEQDEKEDINEDDNNDNDFSNEDENLENNSDNTSDKNN